MAGERSSAAAGLGQMQMLRGRFTVHADIRILDHNMGNVSEGAIETLDLVG